MHIYKDLTECNENETLILSHFNLKDIEVVDRFYSLGLYPNVKFKIISKRMIFILDIKGSRITIPVDIAKHIFVK